MGQVVQFRRNDVFSPEATLAMGNAYDTAIGALPHSQSDFFVRERIAKRIMKALMRGQSTESNSANRNYSASMSGPKVAKGRFF
jgi:hypothetical protein